MFDDIAIKVEGVSKKFSRNLNHVMLYGVQDITKNMIGLSSNSWKLRNGEFWAVNDVSFEVKRGETLGIIGANGSGKTTLLKLLNGIFMPDKGKIEIRGRVGALIEVGAGFHPILTGRENIYINGAILGMSKKEVDKKFDQIVDFANIGDFIDLPVKHYSSGMYVRLGFAVAVHCEPDILLIDEVLAVGDEGFRRKCMSKLNEFKSTEKAIVLISHSMELIQGYCSRVMWINKGVVKEIGDAGNVIDSYFHHIVEVSQELEKADRRWGSGDAAIVNVRLLNANGEDVIKVKGGDEVSIVAKVKFNKSVENPVFGLLLKNSGGTWVYGTNTMWQHKKFATFYAGEEITVTFKQNVHLISDVYYLDLAVAYSDAITFCEWWENAIKLSVETSERAVGIAKLDSEIFVERQYLANVRKIND
jgi:ABC-type polysaccharide/polyol phosphate transport system ATPase subunit